MRREDMIMARPKELKYLHVIRKVLDKAMSQVEASAVLSLSPRQIRRRVKRVRLEGDRGVIHRSRGRPSNRRISEEIRGKIIALYRSEYSDFGPTLASEELLERNQLRVNDETLRLWLMQSGDWSKRRKRRSYRRWRERKPHRGEMVQMDGSHHDWFEGRGSKCVLMSYVDDATGRAFARFYAYEGTLPAMDSFKRYLRQYGIPVRVYVDRHTTYKSPAKASVEDELHNTAPRSQFERALKELGVEVIHAHSAQAKGRVERLFRTLQDRLVKEMRLEGIERLEEANAFLKRYLPVYNRRFSVLPRESPDLHRALPKDLKLDSIFCFKTESTLRNDFTVAYKRKLYQIEGKTQASRVKIHEQLDGSIKIFSHGQALKFRRIDARPAGKADPTLRTRRTRPRPVSADHPWRKGFELRNRKGQTGNRADPSRTVMDWSDSRLTKQELLREIGLRESTDT